MDIERFFESGSIFRLNSHEIAVGYGKRMWLSKPEEISPCFYFPDFFLNEPMPWCTHEQHKIIKIEEFLLKLPREIKPSRQIQWKNDFYSVFVQAFADLQHRFKENQLEKAVPYVFEKSSEKMTQDTLIRSLRSVLKHALLFPIHVYGFWEKNIGMLGGTPEILFSIHTEKTAQLKTMACAGTRRRYAQNKNALMNDTKELKEHAIVVQGIAEALSSFGHVKISGLSMTEVPGLSHLITPITVELPSDVPFEDLVKSLHPTPALGAFPKRGGSDWLSFYQTIVGRGRFGAPVGYLNPSSKQIHCLVAIRNVQWDEGGMSIGAGCGVIAESRCADEWQEILAKIQSIKKILSL